GHGAAVALQFEQHLLRVGERLLDDLRDLAEIALRLVERDLGAAAELVDIEAPLPQHLRAAARLFVRRFGLGGGVGFGIHECPPDSERIGQAGAWGCVTASSPAGEAARRRWKRRARYRRPAARPHRTSA